MLTITHAKLQEIIDKTIRKSQIELLTLIDHKFSDKLRLSDLPADIETIQVIRRIFTTVLTGLQRELFRREL